MNRSHVDLLVRGGTVVTPEGRFEANVAVRDGRIAALTGTGDTPEAERVLDAEGLHVTPGLIDPHVHFRDPGMTYKEDFTTGSASAAAGGITMVVDMPNGTDPPLVSVETFHRKLETVRGRAHVDYGFVAAVLPDNLGEVDGLVEAGILGFKIFMAETVGAIAIPDSGAMLEAYERLSATGLPILTHAENDEIVQHLTRKLRAEGREGIRAHEASRPVVAELEAVQRALLFAETTGAHLHVLHVTCREAAEAILAAKRRGVRVTGETCPHYLLLGDADLERVGTVARMNPPVRGGAHPAALWRGLVNGTFDVIGTDHSPHTAAEKLRDSIWDTIPGWTGVETANALLLTEVNAGRLSLERFVALRSRNPAQVFGLHPRKGSLQIGTDADLTLLDLRKRGVIEGEALRSKAHVTPFEGREVRGMPVGTVVRGHVVMWQGDLADDAVGAYVPPLATVREAVA